MMAASSSSWSVGSSSASGRSTTPARTSGLKQRPITAPARATRPRVVGQPVQAHQDRVADGVRHVGLADPPAIGSRIVVEGRQQLLDVQRDAVGPLVDRLDHVARSRQLAAKDQRRRDRGLLDGQRSEPDLFGVALAEDARSPFAVDAVGRELVRRGSRRPGAAADRPQWRASSPITSRLISSVQCRSSKTSIVGRSIASRIRSAAARTINRRAPRASPSCCRRSRAGPPTGVPHSSSAAHPGGHLADRGERHLVVLRRHGAAVDPQPGRLGLADRGPDQARLAEPGLAGQEDGRCRAR